MIHPDEIIQPNHRLVPDHLRESLESYVKHGRPAGGFLTACLANDLMEAYKRADHISMVAMPHIVAWLYSVAPRACYGSYEAVEQWQKLKGARPATRTAVRGE